MNIHCLFGMEPNLRKMKERTSSYNKQAYERISSTNYKTDYHSKEWDQTSIYRKSNEQTAYKPKQAQTTSQHLIQKKLANWKPPQ